MYALIGRLHIGGKNNKNTWSQLEKYLNHRVVSIEKTKAIVEVSNNDDVFILREKLNKYNYRYGTDFFIEG